MVETYTIHPTRKHNRPSPLATQLHGLDFCPPLQIHNHRFYRPPPDTITNVIEKLKSSLAETLELYPAVAGIVQADENGDQFVLMGPEHTKGTPFLVDIKDTPYTVDSEDLSPRTDDILPPSSSILAVKVTQFSCGTLAVASSINHQATDLRGFLDFLELWAEIARGEAIDFTTIPSDWSRTPGRFFPGLIKESVEPTPLPAPLPFKMRDTPASGPPAFLMVPSKVSRWKFTKSSMEQLKSDFSPSKADQWISSGDALAALISGVITRARKSGNVPRLQGRSSVESETEDIGMAADGRERAPNGKMTNRQYFGNFNPLCNATVSRADLISQTFESASRVALAIRRALQQQLTPEALAYKISFFEDTRNTKPPGRIDFGADVILTNWCRFDLQGPKLSFGWGKPFYATSGGGNVYPPAYSIMTQDKDSGDALVLLTVEAEGDEALKADPLLNKYATQV
ncbi:hypothetical protein BGZ46_000582 [Entomortierella lignicola]|nr:hypothetical protein BGZ46_000582 [Entomortierella lignicola]